jgi:hypothetical protein
LEARITADHPLRAICMLTDGRTTRHSGYRLSTRKRIEEPFGWMKTVGGLRKTRHCGRRLVDWWRRYLSPAIAERAGVDFGRQDDADPFTERPTGCCKRLIGSGLCFRELSDG